MATCVYLEHVLVPHKRRVEYIPPGAIADYAPQWKVPFIAMLDGAPVLRKNWNLIVRDGQVLAFVDVRAIPQGGGGSKNPMRTIAMLVVFVVAAWTGQWYVNAGMLGGAVGGAVVTSVVGMAGAMLVNAVLPPASQQLSSLKQAEQASPSSTYSLQGQSNVARIDSAIPEHFGRHIVWPDLAMQPYQEFQGNEQYLYQLMCVGRGYYDIESIKIEETDISNFDEIDYEIIEPSGDLTLMPGNVITSGEVAGQKMEYNVYVGPFVAAAVGTTANYLGIDFVCPRGVYEVDGEGKLKQISINVRVEGREIDDEGDPVGSYIVLGEHTYTAASATPLRFSEKYELATLGRYEVRVRRDNAEETGTSYGHEIVWGGLRAYLEDDGDYGDCTLIAFKMRASSQLTQQSSNRVNLIATRKLPAWDGEGWTAREATRSIAWAAAYCIKEMGWADEQVDLNTLYRLNEVWMTRGDVCDGRIDNFLPGWESLNKILAAGRAQAFIQAGIVRFYRDQAQSIPVQTFTMRNIIKDSFEIDYLMPTIETADVVNVRYFDGTVWAYRTVPAKLPASSAATPAKKELWGVIGRDQAFKEGMWEAACNRYRRKVIRFQSEMEGFIPSLGDLIAIQHDLPAWGQQGEVREYVSGTGIVKTTEPLTWESGETHYMGFRKRDGSLAGPYLATPGVDDYHVALAVSPALDFQTDMSKGERTHYVFGWGATTYQPAIFLRATPRGDNLVDIEAINEDSNVHTAEIGEFTPVAVTSQLPNFTASPRVTGLRARSKPGDPDIIMLSWQPSPWADSYLVEMSSDYETWSRVGETRASSWTGQILYGNATIVRVAALGAGRGAWAYLWYGDVSDYMWHDDDTTLMWDVDDTTLMWS